MYRVVDSLMLEVEAQANSDATKWIWRVGVVVVVRRMCETLGRRVTPL
jgi:hypothetical protein